jgi:FlaG/FlaF family flagellin (archaellin)
MNIFSRLILAATVLSSTAPAATVVSWNLTGAAGDQVATTGTSASPFVTALEMTRGAGITATSAANSISSSGWNTPPPASGSPAEDTDYFSFGFNVQAGASLSLTSLLIGTRSSSTGPAKIGLYYSGNSFGSPIATINQVADSIVSSSIDLSSLPELTGPVEFRLIEIGNLAANGLGSATGSSGAFRITEYDPLRNSTDVQFTGTVSEISTVPEPGSVFAVGLLLAAGGAIRRRC